MSSTSSGWMPTRSDQFPITNQSDKLALYQIRQLFPLKNNQIIDSRAPGWIHIKSDRFPIENQSDNEL